MARDIFPRPIETTANDIADVRRADLQVLIDPALGARLAAAAEYEGLSRVDMINAIVRDWLTANGYIKVGEMDEDAEAAGEA